MESERGRQRVKFLDLTKHFIGVKTNVFRFAQNREVADPRIYINFGLSAHILCYCIFVYLS